MTYQGNPDYQQTPQEKLARRADLLEHALRKADNRILELELKLSNAAATCSRCKKINSGLLFCQACIPYLTHTIYNEASNKDDTQ